LQDDDPVNRDNQQCKTGLVRKERWGRHCTPLTLEKSCGARLAQARLFTTDHSRPEAGKDATWYPVVNGRPADAGEAETALLPHFAPNP
jgi:hypothetical protein